MNMQEDLEHKQGNNILKDQTNIAVRKLLASSALATAIISWIATAQGLHSYVFSYYWQAAIISAAIQGTLFAFSIKAIPLMKKLKIKGKIAMIILWICILLSSSIFSYVYMSRSVYSNELLEDDSNRIMVTQYLKIYSLINEFLDAEKKTLENKMSEYITLLTTDDGKIEISKEDKEDLSRIKDDIQKYVPESVIVLLNKIQTGSYSENDLQTLNDLLNNENKNNDIQIEDVQQEIATKNEQILEKEGRLKSFRNTNSEDYRNVTKEREKLKSQIEALKKDLEILRDYTKTLDECQSKIKYIEGGLGRKLYNETLELRKYLNQDEIDTNNLMEVVGKIYVDLYNYNISSSDPRLIGYKDFKNYVSQYASLAKNEVIINNDREKVYVIISDKEKMSEESDIKESGEMEYSWKEISGDLQNILKDIPQTSFDQYVLKSENENQEYLSYNKIIELIMNMDRLYLSDLNDFERAWILLRSEIHCYKTLLWFSVIFAFGLDLFSFGTGLLLYFMDDQNKINTPNKRIDLKKYIEYIKSRRKH